MRNALIAAAVLLAIAGVAEAQAASQTYSWDPVPGATAYEIEISVNQGTSWTKVGADVLPASCTGTPVRCSVVVTPPATGLALYRFVAKDATRRTTRTGSGIWVNETWAPLGQTTAVGAQ